MGFIVPGGGGGQVSPTVESYIRNPEWIALPDVDATNSEWIGLVAVYPDTDTNLCVTRFTVTDGYTVDWGDGVVENFASNVKGTHIFDYNTIDPLTTTSEGYRQVIVRVYAQTPANHFTAVHMGDSYITAVRHPVYWLDIKVRTTINCTTFQIGVAANTVNYSTLEQFQWVGAYGGTSLTYLFNGCNFLKKVVIPPSASVTTILAMFLSCSRVFDIVFTDMLPALNAIGSAFQNCRSLVICPDINTTNVASFSSTFSGCRNLVSVANINITSSCVTLVSAFANCNALTTLPVSVDTSNVASLSSTFLNCISLRTVPPLNTGLVTTFASAFSGCFLLEANPCSSYVTGTVFTAVFLNCYNLQSIGTTSFPTSAPNTRSASTMFNFCSKLEEVPDLDLSGFSSVSSMFNGCIALKTVGILNISNASTITSLFNGCVSLVSVKELIMRTDGAVSSAGVFIGCWSLAAIPPMDMIQAGVSGILGDINPSIGYSYATNIFCGLNFLKMGDAGVLSIMENINPSTTLATKTLGLAGSVFAANTPTYATSGHGATAGSATVTLANTGNVQVGQYIFGNSTSMNQNRAITINHTLNIVELVGHGLPAGKEIVVITSANGLTAWRSYYVINPNADDFQLSLTTAGAPITFTGTGAMNMRYTNIVLSFITNTSVTFDAPLSSTGTHTYSYRSGATKTWRWLLKAGTLTVS